MDWAGPNMVGSGSGLDWGKVRSSFGIKWKRERECY